jgi:hypothetical protein
VGTAGAEGFEPAFSGAHLEDARKDETIRGKDDKTGHNDVFTPYNENTKFIDIGAGAGKLEQREEITEVVVDGISITEDQSQNESCVDHGIRKCHQVGTNYEVGTHFWGHDDIIQKEDCSSHIAIIGH